MNILALQMSYFEKGDGSRIVYSMHVPGGASGSFYTCYIDKAAFEVLLKWGKWEEEVKEAAVDGFLVRYAAKLPA
jgi:hypothetical protein